MFQIRSAPGPARWLPAGSAALLWGLSAASAVLWWLHLPSADGPDSPIASLPRSGQIAQGGGSVGRALGHTGTVVIAPDDLKRFRLIGVIASRNGQGSALIAIDGQAPKPYLIGDVLEGGWSLQVLSEEGATLQAAGRILKLDLSRYKKE